MSDIGPDNAEQLLAQTWESDPALIRLHVENQSAYEMLCQEVSYILRNALEQRNVKLAAITHRVKTLKSFVEKAKRKLYDNPIIGITDFAGVRIAHLYKDDIGEIIEVIKSHFDVVQVEDRHSKKDVNEFGYTAHHFLVRLKRSTSGARYNDLKGKLCEIQVRTVLQDAWAIIEHHLIYKDNFQMNDIFRRKLNRIAAILEDADDRFVEIKYERGMYAELVLLRAQSSWNKFIKDDLDRYTLAAYLKIKMPRIPAITADIKGDQLYAILGTFSDRFNELGLLTIEDIEHSIAGVSQSFDFTIEDDGITGLGVLIVFLCRVNESFSEYASLEQVIITSNIVDEWMSH